MNGKGLEGIRFKDTTFVPSAFKFSSQRCQGIRATVTDRTAFRSLRAGLYLLSSLQKLFPKDFDISGIDLWIGKKEVKEMIKKGADVDKIISGWEDDLNNFMKLREKYLLYPP